MKVNNHYWVAGLLLASTALAQKKNVSTQYPHTPLSQTWVADLQDGRYKNPVLHADYSDPDACRVGDDFYMTASSFDAIPGLPILHSKDLVNWTLIGHALPRQVPIEHFETTQHGNGVWAPAIRFHNGEFYIYYPDPDFGIYVIKARNPVGPWTEPVLVEGGKGLIDPCPLWDDDGQVYLVHGWAGSRAGIKSVITVKKMNAEGTKVTDAGSLVYDGHKVDPTVEGPKFYKRNGYYYIFAPAGGVATGWQIVLRSKNVYGPYERRVVMAEGRSGINGPHQGAWVTTSPVNGKSEDWFLHFQDKNEYGRVVHLQPMKWIDNWPVIGTDADGDGIGEPVLTHTKPLTAKKYPAATPPESDEFGETALGKQWQWQANPKGTWAMPAAGFLRLYSYKIPGHAKNLWDVPNMLLQKFPAEEFTVTTKLLFTPNANLTNEKAGLVIMGQSYAAIYLRSGKNKTELVYAKCLKASEGNSETERVLAEFKPETDLYLRVKVNKGGKCEFGFSEDGSQFKTTGEVFQAGVGKWIGAKVGLFCTRETQTNDSGYADFDWFRIAD
ncbi:glycoside hydrolase 43 family protein [Dyadobacter sp. CY261]|uniref:glycoside hydrolase family 43 protein n=1 Tax=Dyadobacter sp. CY261 TaxID=2907203 RepID=UPI001F221E2E|nr:glycoside hydrolase 43 family protein [Dyadobacter sp. CY261]MCF0074693.1 glycoside hydrolase 43 family protein [Dyadobacter sp. CY261]